MSIDEIMLIITAIIGNFQHNKLLLLNLNKYSLVGAVRHKV